MLHSHMIIRITLITRPQSLPARWLLLARILTTIGPVEKWWENGSVELLVRSVHWQQRYYDHVKKRKSKKFLVTYKTQSDRKCSLIINKSMQETIITLLGLTGSKKTCTHSLFDKLSFIILMKQLSNLQRTVWKKVVVCIL